MTDREVFDRIWDRTMIGLSMFFALCCVMLVLSLLGWVFGDHQQPPSDMLIFSAMAVPFCVAWYGFARLIPWTILLIRPSLRDDDWGA